MVPGGSPVRWHHYRPIPVRFPQGFIEYSVNLWESDLALFEDSQSVKPLIVYQRTDCKPFLLHDNLSLVLTWCPSARLIGNLKD